MPVQKNKTGPASQSPAKANRRGAFLLGVLFASSVAAQVTAQKVGSQRIAVTAAEGDSWLNHLHRSFDETSMGKTGRLGPSAEESVTPAPVLRGVSQDRSLLGEMDSVVDSRSAESAMLTLRGSDLYRFSCRGCHGETGAGAPPEIGSVLNPVRATSVALVRERMRSIGMNMSAGQAAEMAQQSTAALLARIRNGGQDMPPLSHLSNAEIASVVAYLKRLAQVPGAENQEVSVTESRVRVGELIVKSTCRVCHSAVGDNPTPQQMAGGAIPPLSALTARVDEAGLIRKVTQGAPVVMGAPAASYRGRMPVFFYLSNEEAADVYMYLANYPPRTDELQDSAAMLGGSAATKNIAAGERAAKYLAVDPSTNDQRTRRVREETSGAMHWVLLVALLAVGLFVVGLVITAREFHRLARESDRRRVEAHARFVQTLAVLAVHPMAMGAARRAADSAYGGSRESA